jgi:hypothetical protein
LFAVHSEPLGEQVKISTHVTVVLGHAAGDNGALVVKLTACGRSTGETASVRRRTRQLTRIGQRRWWSS